MRRDIIKITRVKLPTRSELDESGTVLTLDTGGPILGDPTTSAEYREIIEVEDDD